MFWPWICCYFYLQFARKKRSVDSSFMTGLVAERIQLYYRSRLLAHLPGDQLLHFTGSVLHGRDTVINPETDQSLVSLHSRVICQSPHYRNISGITEDHPLAWASQCYANHAMCFEFSMLNVYPHYGCHLKGREPLWEELLVYIHEAGLLTSCRLILWFPR